jgi:hypothetical protein
MSRTSFLVAFVAILSAFATSCKNDTDLPIVRTRLEPDSDGVVRDIPEDKRREYYQLMVHRTDSSLGLKPLQNGVKGLQSRLFLVEHNGNSWKGELYYFRDSFVKQQYIGAFLIEKTELRQSVRQWRELVSELFRLGVDTLPDYTQLPDYSLDADGDAVLVEIAQDGFYKTYSYPNPDYKRDEVKEAQQIMQIKNLIDKKFGNKLQDPAFGG